MGAQTGSGIGLSPHKMWECPHCQKLGNVSMLMVAPNVDAVICRVCGKEVNGSASSIRQVNEKRWASSHQET